MNWTVVPRVTGGLGCMLVLVLGIATGVDPLLCTVRGLIGGMVGWIAGALWAFVMSQLLPPELPQQSTATPETQNEPPELSQEDNEAEEEAAAA
ncbi:MAG: hypothetical protein SNJ72_01770 [Fimbriimonadales bacterium]